METVNNTLYKLILTAAIVALFFSLTSCYTKKKCIDKFCTTDTVVVNYIDTIRTATIQHDSVFSVQFDTIAIVKDRLQVKLVRVRDSVFLTAKCVGDTIYINKEIKVPVPAPKYTILQHIKAAKWYVAWMFFLGLFLGLFVQIRR
jgi:hypothetical protein